MPGGEKSTDQPTKSPSTALPTPPPTFRPTTDEPSVSPTLSPTTGKFLVEMFTFKDRRFSDKEWRSILHHDIEV